MINTEVKKMLKKAQENIDNLTAYATTENKFDIDLYQKWHLIKFALENIIKIQNQAEAKRG